jgi:hypothetical protein
VALRFCFELFQSVKLWHCLVAEGGGDGRQGGVCGCDFLESL